LYDVMLTPPFDAGADHDNDTCPLPAPAVSPVGGPGAVPAMGEAVIVTLDVAVFAGEALSVRVSVAVQVHAAV
jgi:hypothetical protein